MLLQLEETHGNHEAVADFCWACRTKENLLLISYQRVQYAFEHFLCFPVAEHGLFFLLHT